MRPASGPLPVEHAGLSLDTTAVRRQRQVHGSLRTRPGDRGFQPPALGDSLDDAAAPGVAADVDECALRRVATSDLVAALEKRECASLRVVRLDERYARPSRSAPSHGVISRVNRYNRFSRAESGTFTRTEPFLPPIRRDTS